MLQEIKLFMILTVRNFLCMYQQLNWLVLHGATVAEQGHLQAIAAILQLQLKQATDQVHKLVR